MSRARDRRALLPAAVAVALLLAACTGGATERPPADGTPTSGATEQPTLTAGATDGPTPSGTTNPTATAEPSATEAPTPSETAGASPAAAACSGTDANRAFFTQAAQAIEWPVYCLVLGDGWFLADGSYRLADGGRLTVTYRTSAGLELALLEGDLCQGQDVETCAPLDAVFAGTAAFGDREAGIGQLGGSLVIDVDRGATPSWRLLGTGLAEDAFRAISGAALVVEG